MWCGCASEATSPGVLRTSSGTEIWQSRLWLICQQYTAEVQCWHHQQHNRRANRPHFKVAAYGTEGPQVVVTPGTDGVDNDFYSHVLAKNGGQAGHRVSSHNDGPNLNVQIRPPFGFQLAGTQHNRKLCLFRVQLELLATSPAGKATGAASHHCHVGLQVTRHR